jgi:hypothetical protein
MIGSPEAADAECSFFALHAVKSKKRSREGGVDQTNVSKRLGEIAEQRRAGRRTEFRDASSMCSLKRIPGRDNS